MAKSAFKACQECFSKKIRCIRPNNDVACKRCTSKNLKCCNRSFYKRILVNKDSYDSNVKEIQRLKTQLKMAEDQKFQFFRSSTSALIFLQEYAEISVQNGLRFIFNELFQSSSIALLKSPTYLLPDIQVANTKLSVAYKTLCFDYHLMAPKKTSAYIEDIYNGTLSEGIEVIRLFLMLSFGELYSNRRTKSYPGLSYFSMALKVLDSLEEEPSLSYIEILLLSSLYLNSIGYLKKSYLYVGMAKRFCVVLGLNNKHRYSTIELAFEVERMKRVWWTTYILDVFMNSNLGMCDYVRNETSLVDLPSENEDLDIQSESNLTTVFFLNRRISLAIINERIITLSTKKVCDLQMLEESLLILDSLKQFHNSFLLNTRDIDNEYTRKVFNRSTVSIKLRYNECIILVTRIFFAMVNSIKLQDILINNYGGKVVELSEICIEAALANYNVIKQLFDDNDLSYFGYFDTYFLFSSSIILLIASRSKISQQLEDQDIYIKANDSLSLLDTIREMRNISSEFFHLRLVDLLELLEKSNEVHSLQILTEYLQSDVREIKLDMLVNDIFL